MANENPILNALTQMEERLVGESAGEQGAAMGAVVEHDPHGLPRQDPGDDRADPVLESHPNHPRRVLRRPSRFASLHRA